LTALAAGDHAKDRTEEGSLEEEPKGSLRDIREAGPRRRPKKGRKPSKKKPNRKPKKPIKHSIDRKNKINKNRPKKNKLTRPKRPLGPAKRKETRQSAETVTKECLVNVLKSKKLNIKGANYMRQHRRIVKQNATGGKKFGQKGIFSRLSTKLVDVGGGNKSVLMCSGSSDSEGAKNLAQAVADLDKCNDEVATACNVSSYPLPANFTVLGACNTVFEDLAKALKKCEEMDPSSSPVADVCSCYNVDADLIKKAGDCKSISEENAGTTRQHKKCMNAFKKCNGIKKDSPKLLYSCSKSTTELRAKAAQAKENVDALEKATAKAKALAASRKLQKSKRALASCADVTSTITKLLAAAAATPFASIVQELANLVIQSGSVTCSTDEKAMLVTQAESLEEAKENTQNVLDDFKAAIGDTTGTEPSESELTLSPSSTKAMAKRMDRLVRDVLKKMTNN